MFADRYTLDGKPLSTRHSVGMLAAATVGSLAATPGPNEKAFVEELWRTPIPVGGQRYFDSMLYMFSMLQVQRQLPHLAARQPHQLADGSSLAGRTSSPESRSASPRP